MQLDNSNCLVWSVNGVPGRSQTAPDEPVLVLLLLEIRSSLTYVQSQNFSLAVSSVHQLQVVGHALAAKASGFELLQSFCLVMAATVLSSCIFLYPCFYFPHRFLWKNSDIDLDKNENAFDGTMWSQTIWALKMITLVQSDLLRWGFVCMCLCVPAFDVL